MAMSVSVPRREFTFVLTCIGPLGETITLALLAVSTLRNASYNAAVARCAHLSPQQRTLLCRDLAAFGAAARTTAFCGLPLFLSEAGAALEARSASTTLDANSAPRPSSDYRPLNELIVVDGEPQTTHVAPSVANALGLPEVQQHLQDRNRFLTPVELLLRHVALHLADLQGDDQVTVLDRLLPLLDVEQANSAPGLVPAEVTGGGVLLKAPCALLDVHDFTIQEIFGISGDIAPALPRSSRLHFPIKVLPSTVRTQLRRLGMRTNDPFCLSFLVQELRSRNGEVPGERYGELQRGLMQRIVESWPQTSIESKVALASEAFVDLSAAADGGEMPETIFSFKSFRGQCSGRLLSLQELVSRNDPVDPYLCWTSLPLCPREFPPFPWYKRPTLDDVLAHARGLGELGDAENVPGYLWTEFRERVVAPMCRFLAESRPFCDALAIAAAASSAAAADSEPPTPAVEDGAAGRAAATAAARSRICAQLRGTKFLAVPLDSGTYSGPHSFVAPWRISLVLRSTGHPCLHSLHIFTNI
jgi:hypothetical protein